MNIRVKKKGRKIKMNHERPSIYTYISDKNK